LSARTWDGSTNNVLHVNDELLSRILVADEDGDGSMESVLIALEWRVPSNATGIALRFGTEMGWSAWTRYYPMDALLLSTTPPSHPLGVRCTKLLPSSLTISIDPVWDDGGEAAEYEALLLPVAAHDRIHGSNSTSLQGFNELALDEIRRTLLHASFNASRYVSGAFHSPSDVQSSESAMLSFAAAGSGVRVLTAGPLRAGILYQIAARARNSVGASQIASSPIETCLTPWAVDTMIPAPVASLTFAASSDPSNISISIVRQGQTGGLPPLSVQAMVLHRTGLLQNSSLLRDIAWDDTSLSASGPGVEDFFSVSSSDQWPSASFTITDLMASARICFAVRYSTEYGWSNWTDTSSTDMCIHTDGPHRPSAPMALRPLYQKEFPDCIYFNIERPKDLGGAEMKGYVVLAIDDFGHELPNRMISAPSIADILLENNPRHIAMLPSTHHTVEASICHLDAGRSYAARAYSVSAAGTSSEVASCEMRTSMAPAIPSAPLVVRANSSGPTSATIELQYPDKDGGAQIDGVWVRLSPTGPN